MIMDTMIMPIKKMITMITIMTKKAIKRMTMMITTMIKKVIKRMTMMITVMKDTLTASMIHIFG